MCVKNGSNLSTAVISGKQLPGLVLLPFEGKVTLLFPGLLVVEEIGLLVFTPFFSSQGGLCFKRRKRKKVQLLHLILSLRGMKCIDADSEQNSPVWLFSLFLCTLIMLLELTAD